MTLRPFGPSVTFTALARMSMPCSMRARASPLNLSSLAAISVSPWLSGFLDCDGRVDDAHDVAFLHDHQVFAVELDLGARPFSEQHAVAALDVERVQLAVLVARARANGDHFALHRLFLRCVGDENAAGALRFRLDTADQDAVLQWTQFHRRSPRTVISLDLALSYWECQQVFRYMGTPNRKYNGENTFSAINYRNKSKYQRSLYLTNDPEFYVADKLS